MNNDVVMIHLDRHRQLKFTHTALKTLEELTGKTIAELDQQMDLMDHDLREKIVYCGLLKDAKSLNETLTLEQMDDLLDEAPSLAHVVEKIVKAWRLAFGASADGTTEGNEHPAEKPVKENRLTGKNRSV